MLPLPPQSPRTREETYRVTLRMPTGKWSLSSTGGFQRREEDTGHSRVGAGASPKVDAWTPKESWGVLRRPRRLKVGGSARAASRTPHSTCLPRQPPSWPWPGVWELAPVLANVPTRLQTTGRARGLTVWERCGCAASLADSPPAPPSSPQTLPPAPPSLPQTEPPSATIIATDTDPSATILATDTPPAPPSSPQTEAPSATPSATEPASSNTAYSSMPSKGHLCLVLCPLTLPPPGTRKVLHTLSLPVLWGASLSLPTPRGRKHQPKAASQGTDADPLSPLLPQ